MISLSELSTIIGTLQELERMHQLNLELLEQLDVIFQWILENDVAIPNKDKFDTLLSRMRSILKEIYFSTPKSLIYRKLTDEKKHLNGTDEEVPEPINVCRGCMLRFYVTIQWNIEQVNVCLDSRAVFWSDADDLFANIK